MPHIDIQMSAGLRNTISGDEFVKSIHVALTQHNTIILKDVKTRLTYLDHYIVGDGTKTHMIHIMIKLMPGRSSALKKEMALSLLKEAMNLVNCDTTSITVETSELDADSYSK